MSDSVRLLALAAFVLGSASLAQEPPLIKATSRLVQVSVIAKSHDQPAAGLTKDNFKVLVDGRPQKISFFSSVAAASDAPVAAAPPAAPDTYTNILPANSQAMNGVTVVLLDLINTKLRDRLFAQQQLIKYLLSIPPTERVGVYTFNGGLHVLHDYTSNMEAFQERLAAANGKLVSVLNTDPSGAIDSTADGAFANMMGVGGGPAARSFYLRSRILGTLNVLKFIASNLSQVLGRKNLIWLSAGFPLTFGFEHISSASKDNAEDFSVEMDATVRALSDGNVAVYPVDARGLTTSPQYNASNAGAPMRPQSGKNPKPMYPGAPKSETDAHQTMEELAHRTGGHAYYNTNDLSKAIHEAVEDSALTYTLGFYPDDEKHNREFHKLKVEVDQPHINLSYRSGYLDLAEIPKDERTRSVQVHDAMWSPLDATELGVRVQLAPEPSNALNVAVTLDSKGIQIEPKADRFTGRVDFVMVQFDKDGSPVDLATNTPMQTVDLNMHEATYRKFLTEGLNVKQAVNVNPRTTSLRVIVRDYGSGMIGSVTIPMKKTSSM